MALGYSLWDLTGYEGRQILRFRRVSSLLTTQRGELLVVSPVFF